MSESVCSLGLVSSEVGVCVCLGVVRSEVFVDVRSESVCSLGLIRSEVFVDLRSESV